MDHIYIIIPPNNVIPSFDPSFLDKNKKKMTIISCFDKPTNCKLTSCIYKHLDQIKQLTVDKFNWTQYVGKYNDLAKIKTKHLAWEHWTQAGYHQHKNPLNRKSIRDTKDINYVLAMLEILNCASEANHKQILIIDSSDQKIQYANFNKVINDFEDVISEKNLCIFSHNHNNYAYTVNHKMYDMLIAEMSFFLYRFDDIIKMYINTFPDNYVAFNHSAINNSDYVSLDDYHPEKISIRPNMLLTCIPQIKKRYYLNQYNSYIEENSLSNVAVGSLNNIMCKYPFDSIKYSYNSHICLDFSHYLKLCTNLTNHTYFKDFIIEAPNSDLLGFNIIYFDHDFYIRLYPCFINIFKTPPESYAHYKIHGAKEKAIPNNFIFSLVKTNQDYYTQQYMSNVCTLIKSNKKNNFPIFYDSANFDYFDNQKPIIYIITRTSNREQLFKKCCSTINKQYYSNVRHVVSYDTEQSADYIKKYNHIYKTVDLRPYKSKIHPNQYLDVIYDQFITNKFEPGWIIILDDDDKFMTNYALFFLEPHLVDPNNLIIWMLYRPDKFIYPLDKENPIVGDIGSCCYVHHTSLIKKGVWEGNAIGDFQYFKYLFDTAKEKIYLDYPLTGVNYNDQVSGWAAL